jgi:ribosomal protein L7/L12
MLSPDPDPDIEASVPVHLKARLAEAEKQLQEISGKEPVGVAGRLFAIILIATPLSLAGLVMFIFGGIDASSRSGLIKDTLGISAESVTHWGLFLLLLCGVPVVIIMLADWKIKNGLQFRKQMAEASTSKKLKIDEIREIRSDIEKERERIGSDLERIRQERSALMARVLQGHHTDSSPPDRTSVPDPSKTKFDVVLLGLPTDEVAVLTVIKAVSELNTKAGKGMMEAFLKSGVFTSGTLSRTLPMTVLAEATKQDAENAQIILEAAGAKVVLR